MRCLLLSFALSTLVFMPVSVKAQTTILENFIVFNCIDTFDKVPLINEIKAEHDTLILNCHVIDDTLESEFEVKGCDDKIIPYIQRDITAGHNTPFTAINGRYLTAIGHSGIHHSGIALADRENPLLTIPFTLKDNILSAKLPALQGVESPLDLWLYAYVFESEQELQLPPYGAEELPSANFINLVNKLENLGDWDGNPQSISIPLHDFKADGFALIAQKKKGGPILAMGKIEPGLIAQQSRPQH